ncbi:MAG: TolC family protein [Gemmataceae bacterium]
MRQLESSCPWTHLLPGALICLVCLASMLVAQAPPADTPVPLPPLVMPPAEDRPLPINLPTALKLANVRPLDIALASQRIQVAQAELDQANALWIPSLFLGANYTRHDGKIQDIHGKVFPTSRSALLGGVGPYMVFSVSDALLAPLAARQIVVAREADAQAVVNNTFLDVAEAYFNVQQARGEAAGSLDAARRAEDVVRRTRLLAEGLTPRVEIDRAEAELARRQQAAEQAQEHWETASAELARILRLPASALVVPLELPHLRVELIDLRQEVDELVGIALQHRPELARDQALVQATLARLRQARLRPLLPGVMLRGNGTNPGGTLSTGYFGGGINDDLSNFGMRNSVDVQVLWELRNLGFGDLASMRGKQAENQAAVLELLRTQDRVASEVVKALAQARRAAQRHGLAERGLRRARESAEKNILGLGQTRRVGDVNTLVFRPQEVVASIQALDQAYHDFFTATADVNRAQFRLYRALGHPAQHLAMATLPQPYPIAISDLPVLPPPVP